MRGFIEIHYKEIRQISGENRTKEIVRKKLISVTNSLNSVDDNGRIHYDCGAYVDADETYEEIKQKIQEAQGK